MSTIGKSSRFVSRVKSEYTLTGPRPQRLLGTPSPVSDSRIPVAKSPVTPITVYQKKKYIPRRKLPIGDTKFHLELGSPTAKVRDFVYEEETKKNKAGPCDPELRGYETSHPNCTFMNICSEHVQKSSAGTRWRRYAVQFGTFLGYTATLVMIVVAVCVSTSSSLSTIFWLLSRGKGTEEETEPSMFYEEEEEAAENDLIELNPKTFSLTESKHTLSLLDLLMMTLAEVFGWIGSVLLPFDD